jgi:hypothetical protein
MRKEHGLRVIEHRVLRRIFGSEMEEVTGGRKNCIMRSFKMCTILINRMRWVAHAACMGR